MFSVRLIVCIVNFRRGNVSCGGCVVIDFRFFYGYFWYVGIVVCVVCLFCKVVDELCGGW